MPSAEEEAHNCDPRHAVVRDEPPAAFVVSHMAAAGSCDDGVRVSSRRPASTQRRPCARASLILVASSLAAPATAVVIGRPPRASTTTRGLDLSRRGIPPSHAPNDASRAALADASKIGDLVVPNLGVGTISWTPERSKERRAPGLIVPGDRLDGGGAATEAAQRELAQAALRRGCTLFDTAERYSIGAGESLLQKAVEHGPRRPIVATKFTPTPWRRGADSVVEACEASRARLGVESIDLYQIHMPDIVQPGRVLGYVDYKDEKYWAGLARCVELGLVKEVGVSNYGATRLRKCRDFLADNFGVSLASNQIHYSLLARNQGGNQATVDAAKELGVKTLAYYPLARGLLASAARTDKFAAGALSHYARGGTGYVGFSPKNRVVVPPPGVQPLVDALETVGARYGKTVSQVALNWVVCQGVIPIVGATTEKYLDDALGALGWRLSADDREYLESVADGLGFEFRGTFFKRVDSKFVGYGVESWALD